jgi:hypothetical protein
MEDANGEISRSKETMATPEMTTMTHFQVLLNVAAEIAAG